MCIKSPAVANVIACCMVSTGSFWCNPALALSPLVATYMMLPGTEVKSNPPTVILPATVMLSTVRS